MKAFKAEHGRCNVPESHGPLGKWVATQRQAYKKGKLPEERILKLDALGFVWNPTPSWDERLGELMKYQAEQGHCNVPAESQGSLGDGWPINAEYLLAVAYLGVHTHQI